MLPAMHKADTANVRRRNRREDTIIQNPKVIDHYNHKMGGADKNDGIIGNYSCKPKSCKWYIKIFFRYLKEGVFNAFIRGGGGGGGGGGALMEFKLEIIASMLGDAGSHVKHHQSLIA